MRPSLSDNYSQRYFVKNQIENLLSTFPRTYAKLLRQRGTASAEKLAFLALLDRGDTIIEAGANFGYFTRVFSRVVGKSGQVHAFEPVPTTYATLKQNCDAAALPAPLTLNPLGLSNEAGETTIYLPGDDSGQASLKRHDSGSWKAETKVKAFTITLTTLDAYREAKGIERIDFFKLDIEGAEPLALEGASNALSTLLPLIHLEANTQWLKDFGKSLPELAAMLKAHGYDTALAYELPAPQRDAYTLIDTGESISTNIIFANQHKHASRLSRMDLK